MWRLQKTIVSDSGKIFILKHNQNLPENQLDFHILDGFCSCNATEMTTDAKRDLPFTMFLLTSSLLFMLALRVG